MEMIMSTIREWIQCVISELKVDREFIGKLRDIRATSGDPGSKSSKDYMVTRNGEKIHPAIAIADEWIDETIYSNDDKHRRKIESYRSSVRKFARTNYDLLYKNLKDHRRVQSTLYRKINNEFTKQLKLNEVLSGFANPSASGPDRALGNLRFDDYTTSARNRGIFDDLEDEETLARQNAESDNEIGHTVNKHRKV